MKKLQLGILLGVFAVALGIWITSIVTEKNSRISELEQQLHAVSGRMEQAYAKYEIPQTESCREIIKDVLLIRTTLDHMRGFKGDVCGKLSNPPADVINPEAHYDFYWDETTNTPVVIKKEDIVAQ